MVKSLKNALILGAYMLFFLVPGSVFAHISTDPTIHIIHMSTSGFEPAVMEINAGDTVVFENLSEERKWAASNIHPTHTIYPGSNVSKCGTDSERTIFDACRELQKGGEYSFVFTKPGSWGYHDHVHANQGGKIIVTGSENTGDASKEKKSLSKKIANWLKIRVARGYFSLFPDKLTTMHEKTSIFEEMKNDLIEDKGKLNYLLSVAGPSKVMADLLSESEHGGSLTDCHQEAHQIGRVAFEIYGAKVSEEGSALCHSVFYHGAMEAFLSKEGTADLAKEITELCGTFETSFSLFECLHGVGHGVMAYENYDLPQALIQCGKLERQWDQQPCYGGAFMKNIVAAKGLGAVGGHDTVWVNEDPQFPCNGVDQSYPVQYECYQMQTSWMLTISQWNYNEVIGECQKARRDMVPVCFKSLGRDIAGATLRDGANIVKLCRTYLKIA